MLTQISPSLPHPTMPPASKRGNPREAINPPNAQLTLTVTQHYGISHFLLLLSYASLQRNCVPLYLWV